MKYEKLILFLLLAGLMLLLLSACGRQRYKVDYGGEKLFYKNAKDSYPAGKQVTVYYDMIATDTDYTFYLDGESIPFTYVDGKGFEITFTMPDHDVELVSDSINSMEGPEEIDEADPYEPDSETQDTTDGTVDKADGNRIALNNVLEIADLLGKSYQECGLQDKPEDNFAEFEGTFFEIPVEGDAWFAASDDDGMILTSAEFTTNQNTMEYVNEKLEELYGEPVDSGEEPYAAINGGAREWYLFDAGNAYINVSQGSKEDFVTVKIKQK